MSYTLSFATAFVASVGFTPVARRLALRLGIVDKPNPRKIHRTPMPLLGGLAMYTAAVLTVLLFMRGDARTQVFGILSGATLLLIVGTLDDRGLLHHQVKLLIAMPLAALILIASGIRATVLDPLFLSSSVSSLLDSPVPLLFSSVALTLLWVVGITAAFSILDHMDGLCAGVAAIASLFFLLFAIINGQVLIGTLAATMLGASLGFLRWNFNPAQIFMGDGGAMFLGFMMATLGLKLRLPDISQSVRWMIPVLILGVPIFDTALVSVSRARRGLIPFRSPGKDHTAHRLTNVGLSQREAVLIMYIMGLFGGLVALLVAHLAPQTAYLLFVAIVCAAVGGIVLLEQVPFEKQDRPTYRRR